jgi:hypothetical protein
MAGQNAPPVNSAETRVLSNTVKRGVFQTSSARYIVELMKFSQPQREYVIVEVRPMLNKGEASLRKGCSASIGDEIRCCRVMGVIGYEKCVAGNNDPVRIND